MKQVEISLLQEHELTAAEKLLRLSFGKFLGLSEPMNFGNGAIYTNRWYRDPLAVFAAKVDNKLVGFSMVAKWGSCGGFGPIVIHPDYWDRGIGYQLMNTSWSKFEQWETQQIIFCTHANSPKHIYFYGKVGAQPRFLIALCTKAISDSQANPIVQAQRYSQLAPEEQENSLKAAYHLTDKIYSGLDWRSEILLLEQLSIGESLFIWDGAKLIGFAICHYGTGSEATEGNCYVKFAAANSAAAFDQLIEQCEALTANLGLSSLVAGVDTACIDAYRRMLARKFQLKSLSISMHQPNEPGYSRPDVYVIEDRR
ncbi:MAG: GNAT family N-acetyltransferase [Xenococcus sp. (in: cyanobacteria)]